MAIAPSYDLAQAKGRWFFWLSPLADPLACELDYLRFSALSNSNSKFKTSLRHFSGSATFEES